LGLNKENKIDVNPHITVGPSIGPRSSWIDEAAREAGRNPNEIVFVVGNEKRYWIGFKDDYYLSHIYVNLFPEITTA